MKQAKELGIVKAFYTTLHLVLNGDGMWSTNVVAGYQPKHLEFTLLFHSWHKIHVYQHIS